MGYFNIFYKITRLIDMLTRKRNRRAIMVILIIIAVIFILHNKGYCAQSDSDFTTDTSYFMLEEYNSMWDNFLTGFELYYNGNSTQSDRYNSIFDLIRNNVYFPYLYKPENSNVYYLYFYNYTYSKTLIDTSLVYNDNMRVPSTAYNIDIPSGSPYYVLYMNQGYFLSAQNTTTSVINIAVPQILYAKTPSQLVTMMEIGGYTYSLSNNVIVDIRALLRQQNTTLNNIDNSLTNTTYDDSVVDFDTDSVDDVDDTEITGLFTGVIGSFSNALSSYGGTITKIIPLPHGGQLEIPSNIVSSHLGNLTALVEAFWYFVFGIYLFRFVSNLIHKIKTGDILNGYTNDNEIITSSML